MVLDAFGRLFRREYIAIAEAINDEPTGPVLEQCAWIPLNELPDLEIEDSERPLRIVLTDLLEGKKNPREPFLRLG